MQGSVQIDPNDNDIDATILQSAGEQVITAPPVITAPTALTLDEQRARETRDANDAGTATTA